MGYRERPDFLSPSVDDIERSRRSMMIILPIVILQQGIGLFRPDQSAGAAALHIIVFALLTLSIMWWLLGLPMSGMSERERRRLNDEWHRWLVGEGCKWGFAAVVLVGAGLLVAAKWMPLDARKSIYALVSAGTITAAARHAWAHWRGSAEDD